MATIFDRIARSMKKRASYNRTVAELEAMPLSTAFDLDIFPGDARKIARKAVYGN